VSAGPLTVAPPAVEGAADDRRPDGAIPPVGTTDRPLDRPAGPATAILAGMHVAFLGFGLIAGSIARAVRANDATADWMLAAWSPSGAGPREAASEGVVDVAGVEPGDVLVGADLVVLAAPATDCLALIDRLAGPWREFLSERAVVTDVASTKARLVERADAAGLRFVGGHPMAGREMTGYAASVSDLFLDRPWVVVPGALASPADVDRVTALADACLARVVVMDAAAHDRAVAGISHLPLVVAVALVEAVVDATQAAARDWPAAAGLAASGWRDMTRLARGDPAMGAAIVATNASALAARVRDLRAVLDAWLVELERSDGPDETAIAARLEAARALLDASR
jgi:prephenate dehydrogenase